MHAFWLVLTYDLQEDRRIDDVINKTFLILYYAAPRVPLFCSYHILTSSVIYYWTDARQLEIYLLNIFLDEWVEMRKWETRWLMFVFL